MTGVQTCALPIYQINSSKEGLINNQDNAPLYFASNNMTKMTLAANGNLGVGTTSPTQQLHVSGRILATGSGYITSPAGPVFGQYNSTTGAYTGAQSTSGYAGEYIQLQFANGAYSTGGYVITSLQTTYFGRAPKLWKVFGSTDGTTWQVLDDRSSTAPTWTVNSLASYCKFGYNVGSTSSNLKYFRLVANTIYATGGNNRCALTGFVVQTGGGVWGSAGNTL